METKTNPMRHLDKLKIPYEVVHTEGGFTNGMDIARINGQDPNRVFKTLMTVGKEKCYYCFMVPVSGELDLKKAAASVGEKSVSMLKSDQLLPLMGYVHGGCSPLCTKRPVRITIDSTAQDDSYMFFSAGKIGWQLRVSVSDLPKMMDFQFADIRKPI
jgi:Cys-tRNA(Pro)/Cys-tRNA(Cys) deacylase